jgi:hypothetical protein
VIFRHWQNSSIEFNRTAFGAKKGPLSGAILFLQNFSETYDAGFANESCRPMRVRQRR